MEYPDRKDWIAVDVFMWVYGSVRSGAPRGVVCISSLDFIRLPVNILPV